MSKRKQKILLTKARADRIARAIKKGNYAKVASRLCGISEPSYYRYLSQGEDDLREGKDTVFAYFSKAIEEAEAYLEDKLVSELTASKDERVRLTMLSRRFRNRWTNRQEITGEDGGAIKVDADVSMPVMAVVVSADKLEDDGEILDYTEEAKDE